MRKEPFNFDVADWMNDPVVCLLRPSTRAIWFDALCHMHNLGRTGELSGSMLELAKLCRCTSAEMREAVDELKRRGCADVTERHKIVTLINRRMKREAEARKAWRDRKKRQRDKGPDSSVTQMSRTTSRKCHTKDSDGPPPPDGFSPHIPLSSFPPAPALTPRKATEPDPVVVGVRDFLHKHPRLNWNQKMQDQLVLLVREKGWPWTEKAIDGRISEGDGDPIGTLAKRLKRPGYHGSTPRERSAVAAAGREDN